MYIFTSQSRTLPPATYSSLALPPGSPVRCVFCLCKQNTVQSQCKGITLRGTPCSRTHRISAWRGRCRQHYFRNTSWWLTQYYHIWGLFINYTPKGRMLWKCYLCELNALTTRPCVLVQDSLSLLRSGGNHGSANLNVLMCWFYWLHAPRDLEYTTMCT